MNYVDLAIVATTVVIGYELLEVLVLFMLQKNIDNIRKREKGVIYNYAKMKLGNRFDTL